MAPQSVSQKFYRGRQITLKMELTPEQYACLAEWSANIPTLYFLDICVVGATKLSSVALETNARKARCVAYLRSLDRPQHSFSYLCALMEKVSDSRGIISETELEEQILGDLAALRAFFKSASVYEPDEFVIEFVRALRGSAVELQRSSYLSFLEGINNRLGLKDPVSPILRLEKVKEIVNEADGLKISRQHPMVLLSLACLYGNPGARKLMKFKANPEKFDAENVLADIMAISRFAQLKLQIEFIGRQGGKFLRSDFITDDDGLIGVLRCFEPNAVKHEEKDQVCETQLTFTVKLEQLLTEIRLNEYEQLLGLLTCAPTSLVNNY